MTERRPKFEWEKRRLESVMRRARVEDSMRPLDDWLVKIGQQCGEILAVHDLPAKKRQMVTDIMNKAFLYNHDLSWKQINAIERIYESYVRKS